MDGGAGHLVAKSVPIDLGGRHFADEALRNPLAHNRLVGFFLNVFMSFRRLWLVAIAFVLTPILGVSRTFKILFTGAPTAALLSVATVMDVARSVGFLFPAI